MSESPPTILLSRVRARNSAANGKAGDGASKSRPVHQRELKQLSGLHETYRSNKRPGTVVVVHAPQAQTASRLVKEWRRDLMRRGEQVFDGKSSGGGGKTYRALRDLVSSYYAWLEDLGLVSDELHKLFVDLSACLGMGVRPAGGGDNQVTQPGQIYFYELLGRFLVEASQTRPAVLIISDLHLADSASLAAVVYVAQNFALDPIDAYVPDGVRREGFRGMLVLTLQSHQEEEGSTGLLRTLGRGLRNRPHAEFVDLRGVDEETVRQFLQQPHVIARFLNSTGGNPENLDAVLELMPLSGEELLQQRLSEVGGDTRTMLQTLAVFGRPMSPDVLVQLSELAPDAGAHSLTSLLESGILTRRVGRGELQVAFAQDQAAAIVYDGIDPDRRASLHGEVAHFLRARQKYGHAVEVEEIAHHFLLSDDREDAAEYALAAAEKLHMTFAYQRARDILVSALDVVEGERREVVYERLIDICSALNEHRRALFYCGQLKALKGEDLARVYRRIGKILLDMGKYDLAVRTLAKALHRAGADGDDLELVRVLSHTAEALYGRGEYDEAVEVCKKGLDLSESVEQTPEVVRQQMNLTNTMGKVCLFREDYAKAGEYFDINRDRAETVGWGDEEVRALFNLGTIAVQKRNYNHAEEIFLQCLSFGHETANPISRAFCLLNLAVIYQKTLRYEEALDCYLHGLATFKKSGDDLRFAATAMNLAVLYETLSDLPKAKALIDAAMELTRAREMRYVYARNCYVRGKIALEERQPGQALEHLMQAREGFEGAGRTLKAKLALAIATAHHMLDQSDERDRWLEKIDDNNDSAEGRELAGDLVLLRARIAFGDDEHRQAEALGREARQIFQGCEVPDKSWRASFEIARVCRALGRIEEAKLHATQAVETVNELAENVPEALREQYLANSARQRLFRLQRALDGGGPFEERGKKGEIEVDRDPTEVSMPSMSADIVVIGQPLPPEVRVWRRRYNDVVGEDPRLHHIFRLIDKVAASESTVLITGESGTGKELIAEAIHDRSTRSEGPLIKVNCAAFVETLLLSELFGHEKGAFTGALSRKKGRFELAHGGTIFLDEIGDISMNTQVSLLRILQERSFERVGGSQQIEVDVRVIAATNRNLEEMVREGTFRLDLYYRLKGVALELPPLRNRRGDIPLLVRHFTEMFSEASERDRRFSHDALRLLARYNWPGNIRELENFVRSMLLFVEDDTIGADDIHEFDEFFAEGEMVDDVPTFVFDQRWWPAEGEEPLEDRTPDGGTDDAEDVGEDDEGEPADGEDAPDADEDGKDEDGPRPEWLDSPKDAVVEEIVLDGLGLQDFKKHLEILCIKRALIETEGNITHAARLLKMKRPRLSQIINSNDELGALKDRLT